jgi:arginase family enzyme
MLHADRRWVFIDSEGVLDALPSEAALLLHLDIDVFADAALPAAYFPHAEGLTLAEGAALLKAIGADPRVRLVEVSEYATLRDLDRRRVGELTDALVGALAR